MADQKQTVKFGDICREVKLSSKDPLAEGYDKYIGLEHLDSGSLKIKRWGSIAEDSPSFTRVFKKGQLLFGKRRPYLKKAAIAEFDGICSGDIIVMEPIGKTINHRLLPFIVQSNGFWNWAVKTSSGSLSPRTKYKSLVEYSFIYLSADKQKAIADIGEKINLLLDHVDNLEDSIVSLIVALTNDVLNSRRIKRQKLCELVDLQVGYAFKSRDFVSNGIALMRGANVGTHSPDWSNGKEFLPESQTERFSEYLLKEGDIIIAMDRPFTGSGFKVSRLSKHDLPCLLVQRVGRFFGFNGITKEYLWIILNSDFVKGFLLSQQKGMDIPHLSKKEILDCVVPLVTDSEQRYLSESVNALLYQNFVVTQQVHYLAAGEVYFDIVLYVNGMPLVVGEVKSATRPSVSWQDGAADFIGGSKHYWKNVEAFFVPNLLCFASEGKTFAYGAINAGVKDWGPWHKTSQRETIPANLASVLDSAEGLLNPQTLLQLLHSFALFSTVKTGKNTPPKRIKLLPRYPQFETAKQIVERVKAGFPRKGLIWHFQGSGKSLLMLYAARMLRADNSLKNPTVLVVVDRRDLDSQINETFGGADVKNLIKVRSCRKLGELIEQDSRGILITTVFKFKEVEMDENNPNGLNARDNIIVLVDEAHRTQEGSLGDKMRWALPNAHFYGLTGTPISSLERNTFKLFGAEEDEGRYMNRYSYKQSIRDGATNPVKFEPRLAELRVDREAIDAEFKRLVEANNLDDDEKAALSKRAGKLAILLKAPKRMQAVSEDIAEHFNSHVKPKKMKGMVVVYDREACVQMYYLLGAQLGFDALEVVMNVDQSPIKVTEGDKKDKRNKDWVKWKEALNLPIQATDFERWQLLDGDEQQQKDLIEGYKDAAHPLQLLIVTAKLLTGFDPPICYCMYLDKPLRDHTLLQAMCRTNRLFEIDGIRKELGLIIDYLGVFENLRSALAYDPEEIEGVIEGIEAFKELLPDQLHKCLAFFPGVDRAVEGFEGIMAAQECLPTNDKRDEFAAAFGVLNKLWNAISPDPFLAPYRKDFKWLAQIYESVRPVGQTGSLVWAALGPETIKMIHEHTDIKRIRDDIDELVMDEHAVFTLTEKEQEKRARRLEISLMGRLRGHGDPKFVALGERLEKLRQDYEAGVIKAIDWLKGLLDAAKDTVRMERELDEKVVTEEDNIQALTKLFLETRPDSTPQVIQDIVEQIDKIVKATRFDGWQNSNSGPREIQKALLLTLAQFGLGKDKELFNKAYGYIEEHY